METAIFLLVVLIGLVVGDVMLVRSLRHRRKAPADRMAPTGRKAPADRESLTGRKAPTDRKAPANRKATADRKPPADRA